MRQNEYQSQGEPQRMRALLSVTRRIAAVISECNYAQRRTLDLHMTPARERSGRDRVAC